MRKLQQRDIELLTLVGRFRMLTRGQVRQLLFASTSNSIVSRCIDRLVSREYLGVERLHGNGIQLLWLTRRGRQLLIDGGVPRADLFVASGPVAAKDLSHSEAIGDVAVWLASRSPVPDEVLPAWALQRTFEGRLRTIPDLLAIWRGEVTVALAIEVDRGTEGLSRVFAPKLAQLSDAIASMFGSDSSILAIVPSASRRDRLRELTVDAVVPVHVETYEVLTRSAKSSSRFGKPERAAGTELSSAPAAGLSGD